MNFYSILPTASSNQNAPPPAYPGLSENNKISAESNYIPHSYPANTSDPAISQAMTYVSRMVPVRDYGSTIAVHRTTVPPANVIILGNCPVCRVSLCENIDFNLIDRHLFNSISHFVFNPIRSACWETKLMCWDFVWPFFSFLSAFFAA